MQQKSEARVVSYGQGSRRSERYGVVFNDTVEDCREYKLQHTTTMSRMVVEYHSASGQLVQE
jgi:hypothetical protein